jgi:hypothetical protein
LQTFWIRARQPMRSKAARKSAIPNEGILAGLEEVAGLQIIRKNGAQPSGRATTTSE